jgi:pyrroloquinoline quinone biosynthesis protein B
VLFNASPDVLEQIRAHAPACSRRARSAIPPSRRVLVTDGQVDHTTGLLMLRERTSPLPVWCTDAVAEDLRSGHPVFEVLRTTAA